MTTISNSFTICSELGKGLNGPGPNLCQSTPNDPRYKSNHMIIPMYTFWSPLITTLIWILKWLGVGVLTLQVHPHAVVSEISTTYSRFLINVHLILFPKWNNGAVCGIWLLILAKILQKDHLNTKIWSLIFDK